MLLPEGRGSAWRGVLCQIANKKDEWKQMDGLVGIEWVISPWGGGVSRFSRPAVLGIGSIEEKGGARGDWMESKAIYRHTQREDEEEAQHGGKPTGNTGRRRMGARSA